MALKLSNKEAAILRDYLLEHEDDIAHGMNDFACLLPLFQKVCNRLPEK
jgi:hypothetical protein